MRAMWSADQLDRARALVADKKVEHVAGNDWTVAGSTNTLYVVRTDGTTTIDCGCPAGKRTSPSRCYHAAAVLIASGGLEVKIDKHPGGQGLPHDEAILPVVIEVYIDEPDVDEVMVLYTGTRVARHADGTWGRRRMSWARIRDWAYGPLVTTDARRLLEAEGCP